MTEHVVAVGGEAIITAACPDGYAPAGYGYFFGHTGGSGSSVIDDRGALHVRGSAPISDDGNIGERPPVGMALIVQNDGPANPPGTDDDRPRKRLGFSKPIEEIRPLLLR